MKFAISAVAAGVLALGALGFAADAGAAPSGVGSAADTVKSLEADGYTVANQRGGEQIAVGVLGYSRASRIHGVCRHSLPINVIACGVMPHLDLTYPRPEIAVITLNRPEKLNALSR